MLLIANLHWRASPAIRTRSPHLTEYALAFILIVVDEFWPGIIEPPEETQTVEYKGAIEWQHLLPKLARGVLALSNTPFGGHLVVGMEKNEDGISYAQKGIPDDLLKTYELQNLKQQLASFGHPSPQVEVSKKEYQGNNFLVLKVRAATYEPIICVRTYTEIDKKTKRDRGTRKGVIYYRSIETESRAATEGDWRDMIARFQVLAAKRYIEELNSLGLGLAQLLSGETPKKDTDLYAAERGGF